MLDKNEKLVANITIKCRITKSKLGCNSANHLNTANDYREPGNKSMSNWRNLKDKSYRKYIQNDLRCRRPTGTAAE